MRSKPQHHKPYGSLQQLPIPECLWNLISMDFIEKLPSSTGFDTILVIVDYLLKQAIFIPTHDTITSAFLLSMSFQNTEFCLMLYLIMAPSLFLTSFAP